jgi:hypothetical protein
MPALTFFKAVVGDCQGRLVPMPRDCKPSTGYPLHHPLTVLSLQDAGMLTGLLDCFGQLFTATVAPGWPTNLQESSAQMATSASHDGASTSTDDSAVPQAVITLRNNEVTRVRANLEAASFESVVSPRIAVRLLHMLVLAIAHKFGSGSSKRLEVIHKVGVLQNAGEHTHIRCRHPVAFGGRGLIWPISGGDMPGNPKGPEGPRISVRNSAAQSGTLNVVQQ